MAKNKLSHQTADGKVHTRLSTRTYAYVIVADLIQECSLAGKKIGPGPSVVAWSNSPSVANFVKQWGRHSKSGLRNEPVNNGTRAEFSL